MPGRSYFVQLVWLVGWACLEPTADAAFQVQFSTVAPGKAAGNVLVLDVGSLWVKRPTQPTISIPTPSECQQRCSALPGCTAFTFCNSTTGCGTGCKAYAQKNPFKEPAAAAAEQSSKPQRGERGEQRGQKQQQQALGPQLPILSFGPFAPSTPASGCNQTNPDKWAFGTCTLLTGGQMQKTSGSPAEGAGWVSAWQVQPVPAACSGLSALACAACDSTADAGSCQLCMKDTRIAAALSVLSLIADGVHPKSTGAPALDQCATCAKLPQQQKQRCVDCVVNHDACNTCITYPGAPTELKLSVMGPCMDCVTSKGKRFTPTCLTCAATPDAAKCTACLPAFYPKLICRTSEYVDCYKPEFDNPCATCQAGAPAAYDTCISCYAIAASKQDCDSCNQLATSEAQKQCYACSQKALAQHSDTPGGCGLCFAQSRPALLQKCLNCVTSRALTGPNRQYCSLCASSDLTDSQAARCYKCLDSKSGSASCSLCSSATSSDAAMASCLACFSNPSNTPDCQDCSTLEPSGSSTLDTTRKQCFDCVLASKLVVPPNAGFVPLSSCALCFNGGVKDTTACIQCNIAAATGITAKTWCGGCAGAKDAPSLASCVSCLQASKLDSSEAYLSKCKVPV